MKASMPVVAFLRLLVLLALAAAPARAERVTLPLNGTWQIADSVAAEPAPTVFRATVAVPGLVHNATPAFPDVDAFDSLELVANQIAQKLLPESARVAAPGVSPAEAQLLLVPAHVHRPGAPGGRDAARQQGPVRHRGLAEREEGRRVRRLLLGGGLRRDAEP